MRAHLVNEGRWRASRGQLGLPAVLRVGEGESRAGGPTVPSMLADAMEAVFGAVFLDAGLDAVTRVVLACYGELLHDANPSTLGKDPKTQLQEILQAQRLPVPEYALVDDHRQVADAGVLGRVPHSRAVHRRKRDGRQPPRRRAGRRDAMRSPPLPQETRKHVADRRCSAALRSRRDRRTAVGGQVDAAERARRVRVSASRRTSRRRRAIESPESAPSPAFSSSSSTRRASRPVTHRSSTSGSTAPFVRRSPTSTSSCSSSTQRASRRPIAPSRICCPRKCR